MNVRCDECGNLFEPRPFEVPIGGGGLSMRFRCPHCGHVYPVATLTPRGVQLRERLAEARRRGDRAEAARLLAAFQREVRKDAK